MNAITQSTMKPSKRILSYMRRTGNKHTAKELAEIMELDVDLCRRRITDISRHLRVIDYVKEGVRPVAVYQAR